MCQVRSFATFKEARVHEEECREHRKNNASNDNPNDVDHQRERLVVACLEDRAKRVEAELDELSIKNKKLVLAMTNLKASVLTMVIAEAEEDNMPVLQYSRRVKKRERKEDNMSLREYARTVNKKKKKSGSS